MKAAFAAEGWRSLVLPLACLLVFFPAEVRSVDSEVNREYQIKAALFHRLLYYVEWPPSSYETPDSPLIIGILGKDPFGSALTSLLDKKVEGRQVKVLYYHSAADLGRCHMLYINLEQRRDVEEVLKKLANRPVLTVADMQDFTQKGGMVNLTSFRNRPKLYINNARAAQAGLQISSRLLGLAEITSH